MPTKNSLSLFLIFAAVLLQGCVSNTAVHIADEHSAIEAEEPAEIPVRPFPTETLYELLVGELGGLRNQPKLALEKYVAQAIETRDSAVTARAANIAVYLRAMPELLQMTELWVQLEPENIQARLLSALALTQTGRYIDAFAHAEFALMNGNGEALMTLAVYSEKADSATQEYLLLQYPRLEEQLPNHASVLMSKAIILQHMKKLDQSLATVKQLQRQSSGNEAAALMVAQLLHQKGDRQAALNSLEKSLQDQPNSRQLRLQYARFLSNDSLSTAHQQLIILAKQYPNDTELQFLLAVASEQLGLKEQARETLTKLLTNPLMAAEVHFQLGRMAEDDEDTAQALIHYRQVRSGRKLVAAAARASKLLAQLDQIDNAQLYLQKLRFEQPGSSVLLYQIESELLLDQQQLRDAYHLLSTALDKHPENISLLYIRSIVSEQNDDFALSEQDLLTILKQDENNAMALNALGYTMTLHTNRYSEAHQLILRALELTPGDPTIIDSLGWVLYLMGQHQEALQQLRLALSQLPDAEIAAHLGEVLWVTGEKNEAETVWKTILEKDPTNTIILDTIQRLRVTP